ncbi:MAG TPA: amidohydrolase family protein [Bacteroidales bacterium]|nr:amidohydrolase family protein [Bacteroidales bacterium]
MMELYAIKPPFQCLSPELKAKLLNGNIRFDVHCHLFTRDYIPDNYFHLRLPWLMKRRMLRRLIRLLRGRRKEDDTWTQHATDFMEVAKKNSLTEVAAEMIEQMDSNFLFCPLMMDMTQAFGKTSVLDMHVQLDSMREARNTHPDRLLPFVALDPNNPEMEQLFFKAFSDEYRFYGVKIYPLLGYLPNHPKLMEVFEVCEALGIPVTTHCGGNSTRALANTFELPFRRYDLQGEKVDGLEYISFKNEQEKGLFFSDPARWLPVLERFPKLRLNLAHFGGDDQWKRFSKNDPNTWVHRIISMMENYENVYTDVSFLLHLTEKIHSCFLETFEELLREKELVRNRTLFGSDYYMVLIHEKIPVVTQNFLFRLDDELENMLTRENPRRFLGL